MRPFISVACALACVLSLGCDESDTPPRAPEPEPPAEPILRPAPPMPVPLPPPAPRRAEIPAATVETAGGACRVAEPVALGATDASATVHVAAQDAGALVAWATPGGAPGVVVRALDPEGAPRADAVTLDVPGDDLIGLASVGARFVVVAHGRDGLALLVIDPDGRPAGAPSIEPLPRGMTPLAHDGRWPVASPWRNVDVRVAGDVVGVAYANDASAGGVVRMHRVRVREDGSLEHLEPFAIELMAGTLRGWLSAGGEELALLAGADEREGDGPVRYLAVAGAEPVRVRGLGGAVRDFTSEHDAFAFVCSEGRDRSFVAAVDRAGALRGEPIPIDAGAPLPPPWGTRIVTRVRSEGSSVELLRRDAALRPIGEPVPIGSIARGGDGSSAWTGRAFLVAWPAPADGGARVDVRTVRCGAP